MIKHVNFQLYRVHPDGVIWKELTIDDNKRIATQIVIIAKLNGREYFILRGFVCDTIRPSKELPVQT